MGWKWSEVYLPKRSRVRWEEDDSSHFPPPLYLPVYFLFFVAFYICLPPLPFSPYFSLFFSVFSFLFSQFPCISGGWGRVCFPVCACFFPCVHESKGNPARSNSRMQAFPLSQTNVIDKKRNSFERGYKPAEPDSYHNPFPFFMETKSS